MPFVLNTVDCRDRRFGEGQVHWRKCGTAEEFRQILCRVSERENPLNADSVYVIDAPYTVVFRGVSVHEESDLFQIAFALNRMSPHPRLVEGRKKHSGKDCNDCNYNQKLYKSESVSFLQFAVLMNQWICEIHFKSPFCLSSCVYYTTKTIFLQGAFVTN